MRYPALSAPDVYGVLFASALTIAVIWVLQLPALAKALLARRGKRKPLALGRRLQMVALLSLAPAVFFLALLALPAREKPMAKPKRTIVKITLLPEPVQPAQPPAPTPEQASRPKQPIEPKQPAKKPRASASKPVPKTPTRPADTTHKTDAEPARPVAEARLARFETFPAPANTKNPAMANTKASGQTQAVSQAACVFCPELGYPALARTRGWRGGELLKFQPTPEGSPQNIVVARSGGHGPLDTATVANVRKSRFTHDDSGGLRMVTSEFHFKLK